MTHMADAGRFHETDAPASSPKEHQKKASLFRDVTETLLMQWQQTILPAMKMLSYTFSMLWLETVVHPIVEGVRGLVLLSGRIVELALGRRHSQTSEALRKTYGLSPKSAKTMRKQGKQEQEENWGTILQEARETSLEDTTPGTAVALLPDKKASSEKTTRPSQMLDHEEIRGLDDIFTTPVQGIFSDEKKPVALPGRYHTRQKSEKISASEPPPAIALIDKSEKESYAARPTALPAKLPARLATVAQAESSEPANEPIRFDESIRRKVRWPEGENVSAVALPETAISRISGTTGLSTTHETLSAVPTLETSMSNSLVRTSDRPAPTAHSSGTGTLDKTRAERPTRQKPPHKTPPRPVALRPTGRFAESSLSKSDGEENRSFDYILHSNKMLANSISHLVDRYFQKVEQEEQRTTPQS